MYEVTEINGKTHIRNTQTGELVSDNGYPLWFGPVAARKAVERLNAGKTLVSVDNRVKGVGDNRSRNWRRRSN